MKRLVVFIVLFIIVLAGFTFSGSSSLSTHKASEIIISINNYSMTLQDAYDNQFFKDYPLIPTSSGVTDLKKYHLGSEVQVYLKGIGRIFLQEIIDQKLIFCRDSSEAFDWAFVFGQSGDEIVFDDNKTLQEKIETADFCGYKWDNDEWSDCSKNSCHKRNVWCQRSDGVPDEDEFCNASLKFVDIDYCYDWSTSDDNWQGQCSNSCGAGVQSRDVWCERCDGARMSDVHCSNGKPSLTKSCVRYSYSYSYGGWSSCTWDWRRNPCDRCDWGGKTFWGTQTRSISCKRCDGATVSLSFCGGGPSSQTQTCKGWTQCSRDNSYCRKSD